jgi:hypothetical protein
MTKWLQVFSVFFLTLSLSFIFAADRAIARWIDKVKVDDDSVELISEVQVSYKDFTKSVDENLRSYLEAMPFVREAKTVSTSHKEIWYMIRFDHEHLLPSGLFVAERIFKTCEEISATCKPKTTYVFRGPAYTYGRQAIELQKSANAEILAESLKVNLALEYKGEEETKTSLELEIEDRRYQGYLSKLVRKGMIEKIPEEIELKKGFYFIAARMMKQIVEGK